MTPYMTLLERLDRREGRVQAPDGRLVAVDSEAGAFAAVAWAARYRAKHERAVVLMLRTQKLSQPVRQSILALVAQLEHLTGEALAQAGRLYERQGLRIDELPASLRGRGFTEEVEFVDGRRRVVTRVYRTPADWIEAGERLSANATRWLQALPVPDGGTRAIGTATPTGMNAAVSTTVTVIYVVVGIGLAAAVGYALYLASAGELFGLLLGNDEGFDRALAEIDAALTRCIGECGSSSDACVDSCIAGAMDDVRGAHRSSTLPLRLLAIGSAAVAGWAVLR
jgi:hypothetical protein